MTAQLTVNRLEVPGATLYYEVRGAGPLLLLIGQPMTSEPFAPLAEILAADHTVVTYDPHGLGRSTIADPSQPITPAVQADDLSRIVTALGGGPADVLGSSGGAVAGLAFAAQHPDQVRTLVAHEPPVTELLPDAVHVRAAVDAVEQTYRAHGPAAAWGAFVSLVMHQGEVTADGVTPADWPPAGPGAGAVEEPDDGAGTDGAGTDGGQAKKDADDALFFLRMLKPFTRYLPDVERLRAHRPRVVVAIGATSGEDIAKRSALALAERLGTRPQVFPGHHGGFMDDPAGFAEAVRRATGGD